MQIIICIRYISYASKIIIIYYCCDFLLIKGALYIFLWIALNLKEIPYDIKPVSLVKGGGEQHSNEFREINPMEQVPALHIDNHTLIESVSIFCYVLFYSLLLAYWDCFTKKFTI